MNDSLYLFLDTNVLIQCRALEELDWSEWQEFKEIHLIVCRTVQREIDDQKNRGNSRVARRARKVSPVLRKIILGEEDYHTIKEVSPRVRLYIESSTVPSQQIKNRLDYNKPDDEIIGYCHRYTQEHPDKDVRLLTHDTGPMMTAKNLNIPVVAVSESWLLPPEHDKAERRVAHLEAEIKRLQRAEPEFHIRCVRTQGEDAGSLEFEYRVFEPLSELDVSKFIGTLKSRFPISDDFGPREPVERNTGSIASRLGAKDYSVPASREKIEQYSDDYRDWVEGCETTLSNLHEALQIREGQPSFRFVIRNQGSRPGKDALVEIKAKGNLLTSPPAWKDDEESDSGGESGLTLNPPPKAPRRRSNSLRTIVSRLSSLAYANPLPLAPTYSPPFDAPGIDQNAFYYKPNRPSSPTRSFSLECQQWRHGTADEYFDVELFVDNCASEVTGAVECVVHAQNLSSPVTMLVGVNIRLTSANTYDHACALISDFR